QSQVHRFMNAIGGYVRHVTSYSLGAGRTLLPHVLRGIDELRSRHTAWASLEKHCQLFVAFGGVPAKNMQVNSGGVSQHDARTAQPRTSRRRVRQREPRAPGPGRGAWRRVDLDTAEYRHGRDAGARTRA